VRPLSDPCPRFRAGQMLAVVPLMMLGLLAAACLLASAEWRSSETTSLLGAGDEAAAAHVSAFRFIPDAAACRRYWSLSTRTLTVSAGHAGYRDCRCY